MDLFEARVKVILDQYELNPYQLHRHLLTKFSFYGVFDFWNDMVNHETYGLLLI
ncbi:unnamed protein product [Schistosoma margrebowiei]|uniref:Uncharacterized protein n=1 Tax=Schistosoma margrebowiei TaxID=48269 RepID=A0A3P7ZWZ4_9TREM|nr:unnamed protein product [Schistosoma margrebowiei]